MSWGVSFMYYHCPQCDLKFKYALDLIPEFGANFGKCPICHCQGIYEKDGARALDDFDYMEVE